MKGKYIAAIAATVVIAATSIAVSGCVIDDEAAIDGTMQVTAGCVTCADGCAGTCGSCIGDDDMNCVDCFVCSTCFFCYLDGGYKSCMTDDDDDDEDRNSSRRLTSNYEVTSAPLAGTKSYNVITVKLDYTLYGGETPVTDACIHSNLELADGRTISASQVVGDIYYGQENSAEFKFYVERDIQPDSCAFTYALYGND